MRYFSHGFLLFFLFFSCISYSAHSVYGPTAAKEQLYQIAMRVRPNSEVNVQQVMLAILKSNPEAFNGHNINGLRSGYKLRIPSLANIQKIGLNEAIKKANDQNLEWHKSLKTADISADKNEIALPAKEVPKQTKENLADFANQQQDSASNKNTENTQPVLEIEAPEPTANFVSETKAFEQQTSKQLALLEEQNRTLEAKVNQLTEELRTVTYHFIQLTTNNRPKNNNYALLLNNIRANALSLSIGFLALIILSYLLIRTFRTANEPPAKKAVKDEYDYMSSQESIPSKLDLARAYIDMGDHLAAMDVLREVKAKGNKEQQTGANELLAKLNAM